MWRYVVEPARPQMTIWRMLIACWTPKATNTHSEYVILVLLRGNIGYMNPPRPYVIRTLPVLLHLRTASQAGVIFSSHIGKFIK